MTYFHTCRACVGNGACELQSDMKTKLAGLGVRSLKHRCTSRVDLFSPGDPIVVETWPTFRNDDEDGARARCWFRGHFVQYAGNKPLVFVAAGTISEDGGWEFYPNGNGFLKVSLSRVKPREGDRVAVTACRWCAAIPSLGQPCGRDPNYTPMRDCLAANMTAQADGEGRVPSSTSDRAGKIPG